MTRPDDPFIYPSADPTDTRPVRSPAVSRMQACFAYAALAAALFEIPWYRGGLWRPLFAEVGASWWPTGGADVIRGRALMVGPAIAATILACVALVGRPSNRSYAAALTALILSIGMLFLVHLGRVGDRVM